MKPLYAFVVKATTRYNNVVDVEGKSLIVNTEITERDAQFVNRVGIVTHTPLLFDTPIKVGDQVIVHHNVFRRWYDQYGKERNGAGYIGNSSFLVSADQIFGYRYVGSWKSTPGYCFVTPLPNDDLWDVDLEKPLRGILTYSNNDITIPVGNTIGFVPGSEYEFVIEGQKLYRILSSKITIDYGLQKGATQDYRVGQESAY